MADIGRLRVYFDELLSTGSSNASEQARDDIFQKIISAYSESHRHYHVLDHLEDLFDLLEKYAPHFTSRQRADAIAFFFWHDYMYLTHSLEVIGKNEIESAKRLSSDFNILGLNRDCTYLEKLIIASKTHDLENGDVFGALLLDMDMSILGRDQITYDSYRGKIRKEFQGFPDAVFYTSRRDLFLVPTLLKQRIFITDTFERDFGFSAMENIKREVGVINAAYHC